MRKCDDLSRLLRGIGDEYEHSGIALGERDEKASVDLNLDDVEDKIRAVDDELSGLKTMQETLLKSHNALQEQKLVLENGKKIYVKKSYAGSMPAPSAERSYTSELMALSEFSQSSSSLLGQVSGVVKSDQVASLERVLFRATRGNAVFESAEIEQLLLEADSKGTPEPVQKSFFMVLFAGEVCAYREIEAT